MFDHQSGAFVNRVQLCVDSHLAQQLQHYFVAVREDSFFSALRA